MFHSKRLPPVTAQPPSSPNPAPGARLTDFSGSSGPSAVVRTGWTDWTDAFDRPCPPSWVPGDQCPCKVCRSIREGTNQRPFPLRCGGGWLLRGPHTAYRTRPIHAVPAVAYVFGPKKMAGDEERLPTHLHWLTTGIQAGFLARHHCPFCGRAINPALTTCTEDSWNGIGYKTSWPDGDPEPTCTPYELPWGGWKAQKGAVPPHAGRLCTRMSCASEVHVGPDQQAYDRTCRKVRLAAQKTSNPAALEYVAATNSLRLRTELLGEDQFQLEH